MKRRGLIIILSIAVLLSQWGYAYAEKPIDVEKMSPQQLAAILGWVEDKKSCDVCQGYYLELSFDDTLALQTKETHITANQATLNQNGPSLLQGNVIVTQPNRRLTADEAVSTPCKTDKNSQTINVSGKVRMNEPGMLIASDNATVETKSNAATLNNNVFRFQVIPGQQTVIDSQHQQKVLHIEGKSYRGQASVMKQIKPQYLELKGVKMTTCNPLDNTWKIEASSLYLDQDEGLGTAYNARLLFYSVPVFYSPYFRFPIDNRRRTGLLAPDFSVSSRAGTTIGLPFYLNLAPNYDLTLYPYYYSKRGKQLGAAFRYLTDIGTGQIYFSQLNNDMAFADFQKTAAADYPSNPALSRLEHLSTDRQQFVWSDISQYDVNWSSQTNINWVGDDYYLQDFGNAPITPTDPFADLYPTTQLPQTVSTTYSTRHFSLSASMENYQTLHPVTLPSTADQYARLPEIDSDITYPDSFLGLDYDLPTQYTKFADPWFESNVTLNMPTQNGNVIGSRYNTQPSISYYGMKPWGYFHPSVEFSGTTYQLNNTDPNSTTPAAQKANPNFAVPLYDIDTGLYFDRQINFGKENFTQTLEPRLFYLYVPYVNQNNLPVFDTSLNSGWFYDELFTNDRFSGVDRIGDANQISAGLTSRFINNDTGNDSLDLSVGQVFYFEDRDVQLSSTTPPDTYKASPVVGQVVWQFNQYWNSTDNVAYNQHLNIFESVNTAINYVRDNQHLLSLGYSLSQPIDENTNQETSATISQWSIGSAWQFTPHWELYGAINYNDSNNFPQTYLYGVQYNSCCWSVRAINSENFIGFQSDQTTPIFDRQFFLQFTLTGLTSMSSGNAQTLLQATIPNYNDTFTQQRLTLPNI